MQRICVFCGSSFGTLPAYRRSAVALGRTLAEQQVELVFGGGKVGLMGTVARAALERGGRVTGVIPSSLMRRELALDECSELRIVDTMHERKAVMAELSDAFIAMPGGLGTLEELFEALTWLQLGIHTKPTGLLNVSGYYDGLLSFLDHTVESGFVLQEHRLMIAVSEDPQALLAELAAFTVPEVDKVKWIRDHAT